MPRSRTREAAPARDLTHPAAHRPQNIGRHMSLRRLATAASPVYNRPAMRVITTDFRPFRDLLPALPNGEFVAVDTEFMREQTFWPDLCLIQLKGPAEEAIVDPLAPGIDLKPFYDLMADSASSRSSTPRARTSKSSYCEAGLIPTPGLRHPDRRHGLRLRRKRELRQSGQEGHRPRPRQELALHRLGPPPADRQAARSLRYGDVTHLRDIYIAPQDASLRTAGRESWLDEEMADLTVALRLTKAIPRTPGSASRCASRTARRSPFWSSWRPGANAWRRRRTCRAAASCATKRSTTSPTSSRLRPDKLSELPER